MLPSLHEGGCTKGGDGEERGVASTRRQPTAIDLNSFAAATLLSSPRRMSGLRTWEVIDQSLRYVSEKVRARRPREQEREARRGGLRPKSLGRFLPRDARLGGAPRRGVFSLPTPSSSPSPLTASPPSRPSPPVEPPTDCSDEQGVEGELNQAAVEAAL